ncbi:MAG: M23 family metallopeptidase [Campylobacterales bacterium]|nr:M23 family metallopeptidase [Campylobacterales bacterium]
MDKHFTITIHDENGVKQFNIHKFVKKAFVYALGFVVSMVLIASATILYLDYSVDKVQEKKDSIEQAYLALEEKNRSLQESINETNLELSGKKKELDELADSLSEIEILIGISPVEDLSLQERVSITKVNSQHKAVLLQLIPNGSPIPYSGITSKFGNRMHPTLNRNEFHRGTDMKAKMNTPVQATADGIVEFAGTHNKSGFGRLVILEHSYGFKSYYGHLNKIVVKSGTFVKKGELIAYSGNSGMSSGPHLHYEIRFLHRVVNPFWFIKWTLENYNEIFEKEKKIPWQSLITATAHLQLSTQTQTLPLSQLVLKSKEQLN